LKFIRSLSIWWIGFLFNLLSVSLGDVVVLWLILVRRWSLFLLVIFAWLRRLLGCRFGTDVANVHSWLRQLSLFLLFLFTQLLLFLFFLLQLFLFFFLFSIGFFFFFLFFFYLFLLFCTRSICLSIFIGCFLLLFGCRLCLLLCLG